MVQHDLFLEKNSSTNLKDFENINGSTNSKGFNTWKQQTGLKYGNKSFIFACWVGK
jgi:hypothetical protein